jgi:hypothetical protein
MSPDAPTLSPDTARAAPAQPVPTRPWSADLLGRVVAASDLGRQPPAPPSWLWHGYVGPGKITLLTSQWKSGKTTLVSLLLARLQQGGPLAGLAVAPARALVISEEGRADWQPRCQRLAIGTQVDLLCRPFTTQPNREQWLALVDTAAALHDRQGCGLVVFDSLAQFLPAHSENSAGALLECLTPLRRLTSAGMSVLLVHHPRKGKALAGQAARGSGALPSFVDILIEMGYHRHPDDVDRRRRLLAFSRHDETPRHLLLELQSDGRDYTVLADGPQADFGEGWLVVLDMLETATAKLTRQAILEDWPAGHDRPVATTLWRWLDIAARQGQVQQEGTGRPRDPFRYWLPERQALMRPDGGTREELQAWNDRVTAEVFARLELRGAAEPAPPPAPAPLDEPPSPAPLAAEEDPASAPESAPPAESPVVLPWPFSIMNPADVPEAVRERARAAQRQREKLT